MTAKLGFCVPFSPASGARKDRVHARRPQTAIVLGVDSSLSEPHGAQDGAPCNDHFGCACYRPLFVFNQLGDPERCAPRPAASSPWSAITASPAPRSAPRRARSRWSDPA
jgi:Transposase DDE domain group 1